MLPYLLYVGRSNCHDCGKTIKKIYVVRGKHYGSECVKRHLDVEISDESLTIQVWLLEIANLYVDFRLHDARRRGERLESIDDFAINFYNINFGVSMVLLDKRGFPLVDNLKSIKISGRTVKPAWYSLLYGYLAQKRREVIAIHPL